MKRRRPILAALLLGLLMAAGAAADTAAPAEPGPGAFGAIGVAVDDGIGYGDGAAAARTPAHLVQALNASGRFASATLNNFDLPQQLRIRIRMSPSGSKEAASGKVIAGAATLFLVPMKQSYDYVFEFELECRGRPVGEWKHQRTLERTQFLLADPHSGVPALMQEAVAAFVQQASESGKLAAGCR